MCGAVLITLPLLCGNMLNCLPLIISFLTPSLPRPLLYSYVILFYFILIFFFCGGVGGVWVINIKPDKAY
jgi:hypothetical protein